MKLLVITLLLNLTLFNVLAFTTNSNANANYQFHRFTHQYGKQYDTFDEYMRCHKNFVNNYHVINVHNKLKHNYQLGINQFSDMSHREFKAFVKSSSLEIERFHTIGNHDNTHGDVPDTIDWRDRNAVTSIKNQQQCGSCWAFSATGSIEGAYAITKGKLVSLSEQQLVDCDKGDNGCNGGIMTSAYEYVIKNGGLDSESCYPYEARDDTCRFDKSCVSATISSYGTVSPNNDTAMVEALARQPVSIAIYAAGSTFQHYNGGVYDDPTCYSDQSHLDHGVLLVGYGTTTDGKDYYILKNSWGTSWGKNGYMQIARGKNTNICGLLDMPCYPIV